MKLQAEQPVLRSRLVRLELSQRWILAGKQSSLLTRIAATESVSLCTRMKS